MKIVKLKTSKLFYGKWTHKIVCKLQGAHEAGTWQKYHKMYAGERWFEEDTRKREARCAPDFEEFERKVLKLMPDEVYTRTSSNEYTLYCKDPEVIERLKKSLHKWIDTVEEPAHDDDVAYMIENGRRKHMCDRLPHNLYGFKITLRTTMNLEQRQSFYEWFKRYKKDSMTAPESTIRWLKERRYNYNPYMYVTNSGNMSMVCMMLGNNVRTIDEYIIRETDKNEKHTDIKNSVDEDKQVIL